MGKENWTRDDEQIIRKLWLEGASGGQIAAFFPGASRNAVIAKANRMGLARAIKRDRVVDTADRMQIRGITLARV